MLCIRSLAQQIVSITDMLLTPVHLTAYSQRDPRWRDKIYAGDVTFGQAGCYVTCVAMIASGAGYIDTPPKVAENLRKAGCFSGAFLSHPDRIPDMYPLLKWDGRRDWRNTPADLNFLSDYLKSHCTILEVEFRPGGAMPPEDQHFVVALRFTDDGEDLIILDPWDGAETRLLRRYAQKHWNLERAIYGMRMLRIK